MGELPVRDAPRLLDDSRIRRRRVGAACKGQDDRSLRDDMSLFQSEHPHLPKPLAVDPQYFGQTNIVTGVISGLACLQGRPTNGRVEMLLEGKSP